MLSFRQILSYNFLSSCRTNLQKFNIQRTIMNNSGGKECTDLVWIDLEMSGLDERKDHIMEIACLITDKQLNIKSEGICLAIQTNQEVINNMNEWCQKHHHESGLVEKCLKSQINISDAEEMVLKYLQENIPPNVSPLAGNSVYVDRIFLRLYMPKVDEYLHYRIVDVSTIKELARRFNPQVLESAPKKKFVHRSLDDILESIKELQYYKENFLKLQ